MNFPDYILSHFDSCPENIQQLLEIKALDPASRFEITCLADFDDFDFSNEQLALLLGLESDIVNAYRIGVHILYADRLKIVTAKQYPMSGLAHAENSCYVAALVTALFSGNNHFDSVFSSSVTPGRDGNVTRTLLLIVNLLRIGDRVHSSLVAIFRECLVSAKILNYEEINEQQDAHQLFVLIMDLLGHNLLEIKQTILHEQEVSEDDESTIRERAIILPVQTNSTSISKMLENYCFDTTVDGIGRSTEDGKQASIPGLLTLTLPNQPTMFPILLKRYQNSGQKRNTRIILPFYVDVKQMIDSGSLLVLSSIICHKGSNITNGHYVSYCSMGNTPDSEWYMFDDMQDAPALFSNYREVVDANMNDIFHKSYLVFYELMKMEDVPFDIFGYFEELNSWEHELIKKDDACILQ